MEWHTRPNILRLVDTPTIKSARVALFHAETKSQRARVREDSPERKGKLANEGKVSRMRDKGCSLTCWLAGAEVEHRKWKR